MLKLSGRQGEAKLGFDVFLSTLFLGQLLSFLKTCRSALFQPFRPANSAKLKLHSINRHIYPLV
jgi:hypothetical protein